jgi:Alcohol acetyltransferase
LKGTFERFRVVLHDLGFHNNVAVVARFSGPESTREVRQELIFHALRKAIQDHPALSATVSGKDTPKPFFERLENIDLREIIRFEDLPFDEVEESKRIDEILSREHSTGFTEDGLPLWRIVVLQKPETQAKSTIYLVFIWHHVIGDGRSGLAVLATVLRQLNSNPQENGIQMSSSGPDARQSRQVNESDPWIVMAPPKPLFPALEEILSLPMSIGTIFSHRLGPWFPSWFNKAAVPGKWSGGPYQCEKPIKTSIKHFKVPPGAVNALLDRCRTESTSITPFLQALAGSVIMETFQDAKWLRCAVALSMRRFFPNDFHIDDTVMGLWVNAFHLEYTRDQLRAPDDGSRFWNLARKNSEQIRYEISKGETDIGIGMLKYIEDFRSTLMAKQGKKREDSYAVTNLGLFDPHLDDVSSSNSPWQLSDMVFSQSCHVNGSAVQFCILTVKDGEMCIALSWQEGIVAEEDVARIADNLRDKLLHMASTPAT